ncbi:MAG: 4Fe-4S binding protein [Armatimonadota bacterium]|nr:4Fe-4S binding protein [Armatimonadota bacterium]
MNRPAGEGNGHPPAAVLLCAHLDGVGSGLDVRVVRGTLEETLPAVHVRTLDEVCRQPRRISAAVRATGAVRLVLGLCRHGYAAAELQAQVRKAGLDPLGVEVVDLGAYAAWVHSRQEATQKARVLLAAGIARARAFTESRPQNLKPLLPGAVSRRGLLSLSLLEYQAVPAVAVERCHAEEGCRECLGTCPHQAFRLEDGEIRLNKSRCTSCGTCVTACPHGAMDLPGWTAGQVEAYLGALLCAPPEELAPRAVLVVCRHGAAALKSLAASGASYPVNWFPLEVPSLGMVPPTWLLALLNLGAAGVGVVSCPQACGATSLAQIERRVDFCREVLKQAGEHPGRVALLPARPSALLETLRTAPKEFIPVSVQAPPVVPAMASPFAYPSRGRVLTALGERLGASSLVLHHPASPFGLVQVGAGCTLCGACAAACGPGALRLECDGEAALTFDPTLCTACGRCLPACPEPGTLILHPRADLRILSRGRVALARSHYGRCEACGGPIAPQPMLERMAALLGGENARGAHIITRYCSACRGLAH